MTRRMTRAMMVWSVAACGVLAWAGSAAAVTRYVRADLASGANDGTSWADAYRGRDGVTRALAAAVSGDEIWVAAGLYTPVLPVGEGGTGSRTTSLALKNGVGIYGGFAGTETMRSQRDFAANVTILSGDINRNDAAYPSTTGWAENSNHLITGGYPGGTAVNATAVLDGFTITHGLANGAGASAHERGAGISLLSGSSPTLRNLVIIHNRATFGGGALYLNQSSPRLEDCRLESNNGGSFGGGCDMASNCAPVWLRCAVIGNTAARAGGIEAFSNCSPQLLNCLIARNTATGSNGGGALFVSASTVTLRNCTVVFNTVTGGGPGPAVSGSTANFNNSIVAFNTGAAQFSVTPGQSYTCVPGGRTDAGNIALTPAFVDAAGNDFRLAGGSAGIDQGNNALLTADMSVDLLRAERRIDDPLTTDAGAGSAPIVDMGCYEFVPPMDACAADFNADGTLDADDLGDYINCYFGVPACGEADFNGDGEDNADDLGDFINAYFAGC